MTTPEQPSSPMEDEQAMLIQQNWAAERREKLLAEGDSFRRDYSSNVLGGAVVSSLFFNGLEANRPTA